MIGLGSDLQVDGVVSATAYKNMNPNDSEASDVKDVCVENAGDNCEKSPNGTIDSEASDAKDVCAGNADDKCEKSPNGTLDLYYPRHDGSAPPKSKSKLSLLGHGPHGKQVVDHILKEHGDDGISQFCQRWRQVFVEAVHPRFLPTGWDVMHRYIAALCFVYMQPLSCFDQHISH